LRDNSSKLVFSTQDPEEFNKFFYSISWEQ
jgi:hypothetical protein